MVSSPMCKIHVIFQWVNIVFVKIEDTMYIANAPANTIEHLSISSVMYHKNAKRSM